MTYLKAMSWLNALAAIYLLTSGDLMLAVLATAYAVAFPFLDKLLPMEECS